MKILIAAIVFGYSVIAVINHFVAQFQAAAAGF